MARPWCGNQGRTWEALNPLGSKQGVCMCLSRVTRRQLRSSGALELRMGLSSLRMGIFCLKEAVTNIPSNILPPNTSFLSQ